MYKVKESSIVIDICAYLHSHGVSVETINIEGYYDTKNGIYRTRNNRFVRNGSADIHATIPPYGQALYIEVKTPSEMTFFDRTHSDAMERLQDAHRRNLSRPQMKKYQHAVEQVEYLEEKRSRGAIAFFSSSIQQTIERLQESGITIE